MRRGLPLPLLLLLTACVKEEPFPNLVELVDLREMCSAPAPPADPTNRLAADARAVALGERLFEDKALSGCGTVSCASCHGGEGYADDQATSVGCDGQRTGRNAPTVLNAAYSKWFMWDGRADRLWSQAILPLTNPREMASGPERIRARLAGTYAAEYQALFGEPPSATADGALLANVGKLLAAYETSLRRTHAPFDDDVRRFIAAAEAGKAERDPAYLGLKTFFRKGRCIACHVGPTLSDQSFHNVGVADPGAGSRGAAEGLPVVLGWEFNAAGPHSDDPKGNAADRMGSLRRRLAETPESFEGTYRSPSLRNVALTAPYMHTGTLATLEDVIEHYDRGGDAPGTFRGVRSNNVLKLELTAKEKAALLALLRSLTGAP